MTTNDLHSRRDRYSFACTYSGLKPNVVRSPEQTTRSGERSLISEIARSIRLGTKYGPPQWRSEMCAIVSRSAAAMRPSLGVRTGGYPDRVEVGRTRFPGISRLRGPPLPE